MANSTVIHTVSWVVDKHYLLVAYTYLYYHGEGRNFTNIIKKDTRAL